MTLAAVIRRAYLAQQLYERRIPVQLELSAPAGDGAPSAVAGRALTTRVPGAEKTKAAA